MGLNKAVTASEKDASITSEFITDVYIAIVRGTRFISNITEKQFSDFIDVCQRIKIVQYLFDRKMNRFLEQNMIEPLLVADKENIDDFFDRHKDRVNQYLDYVKTFINGRPPEPRMRHLLKKDGIFTYCPSCGHEYSCLIMFADEFLPFFKLDNYAKDTIIASKIEMQYKSVKKDIEKILDFYYIDDEQTETCGWPHSLNPTESRYDAYSSAYVMDFIIANRIDTDTIKWSNQGFISKVAQSIISSQTQTGEIDAGLQGFPRDATGTWKNIYWEKEVGQIDVTVDVLRILSKHIKHYTDEVKESLKKAELSAIAFVERCFEEKIDFYSSKYSVTSTGWHPFAMDFPPHEDWFQVQITDITGTIAGLQALLTSDGYKSKSPRIIEIVKWLLSVQMKEGAWPVLSSHCMREAEMSEAQGYCFIQTGDHDAKSSLSNTARAVKALNEWLDDLFSSRKSVALIDPEIDKFERSMRDFISEVLEIVFGDTWWEIIPNEIRTRVETALQNDRKNARKESRRIDYLYIWDYYTIMCTGKSYIYAFKSYFPNVNTINYLIEEINALRNKVAHGHPLPENFEAVRDVNISKLMAHVEKKRISAKWKNELISMAAKFLQENEKIYKKPVVEVIEQLLLLRNTLKQAQRFDDADAIRKELERLHIKVMDKPKNEFAWEMIT